MQRIIERVKQIVFKPRETWEVISTEEATVSELFINYLLILAAVPALASFLGRWIIGIRIPFVGVYRFSFGASLLNAVLDYILTVAGIWVLGKIIYLLAQNFGSTRDELRAFKLAVYTYTPYLAAGVLLIIPSLGVLVVLAGIYGLYLLYIGLPIVMNTPKEKSLAYTIVVIIAVILIYVIVASIAGVVLKAFGPSLPHV